MTSTTWDKIKTFMKKLSAAVIWIAVWQLAAVLVGKELLLPKPLTVLEKLAEMAVTVSFWRNILATLLRIFVGFAIGAVIATALAVLTKSFEMMDFLFGPIIRLIRATPVVSFIILALVWLKTDTLPGFMAMLMVIPIVWGNVVAGIENTDSNLLEMGKCYGFGRAKTVRLIFIPSVKPYFLSGCITAVGNAWKAGVAAEVLCQPKLALGTQLYLSKIYIEIGSLFAWTAAVIILSLFVEKLLILVMRRI